MNAKPVVPGETLGGLEVVWVSAHDRLSERWYEVRYLCCGQPDRIRHAALTKRIYRGSTSCRYCIAGDGEPAPVQRRMPTMDIERRGDCRGATDRRGGFWPHLGKLGPRFAMGGYQSAARRGE